MLLKKGENYEISSFSGTFKNIRIYDSCGKFITCRIGNAINKIELPGKLFHKGLYLLQIDDQCIKLVI